MEGGVVLMDSINSSDLHIEFGKVQKYMVLIQLGQWKTRSTLYISFYQTTKTLVSFFLRIERK
jgi:hypothetical protein